MLIWRMKSEIILVVTNSTPPFSTHCMVIPGFLRCPGLLSVATNNDSPPKEIAFFGDEHRDPSISSANGSASNW